MYAIIWKYKIIPDSKEAFEQLYGSEGSWAKLFRTSKDYLGSHLHNSEEDSNTYLLIDAWRNGQSYMEFLKTNEEQYKLFSSQCEYLYVLEEKIGSFNSVD